MEASQMVPLLSLPAQRASRLPLLLAAILRRLDQRTSEAVICRAALDRLNQVSFNFTLFILKEAKIIQQRDNKMALFIIYRFVMTLMSPCEERSKKSEWFS